MATQSEAVLEKELVAQLQTLGYEKVRISNEDDLVRNLKTQLEKHNGITLSEKEFQDILVSISKGNIFDKATRLRGKLDYNRDDGEIGYLDLVDQVNWCKNEFQVAQQVEMEGSYKNRYDVTLLINGLPLAQIELKRRGLELKEAFNQTNRYQRHSYWAGWGLFGYIQVFVISNGVNTKYYANNPAKQRDFKQTFFWADKENRRIKQLSEFADVFLEPCQLSKLVTKYVVLSETDKLLMVLRQYQYHAVEAIVERVRTSDKFGYIWHTTGSGKTLTSFKAAQILTGTSGIHKVVFVVDRKDLDYKTIGDFNSYKRDSVDATANTRTLVQRLGDDTKLIVTTLQKLNNAIHKRRHATTMKPLRDKRVVFIFDECHRSQFGETHKRIREYFPKAQMFGFTGTPIFVENSLTNEYGRRTTTDLFGECLHKYVITDAINDENVLRFSIEYMSLFKDKKSGKADIQVEAIDTAEVLEAEERLNGIVNHIIAHHDRKTHNRVFNAIFCVSDIKTLLKYYDLFKQKRETGAHDLNVATIFSWQANEDDSDVSDVVDTYFTGAPAGPTNAKDQTEHENQVRDHEAVYGADYPTDTSYQYSDPHSRDRLENCIRDYNKAYGTNYSTDTFYYYYQDIGKRVRYRHTNRHTGDGIDILLVVNMFLTGFDSQWLNTIYVDKNLRYHGLVQAYSRTNRILGSKKSHGNVVCYRNLKPATDEAVALFADKDTVDTIALEPYEKYIELFNDAVAELLEIAATVDSVDELPREEDQLAFIKAFRNLLRLMNVLISFTEFKFENLAMEEQTFEDYKSKYLDLNDKVKTDRQKEKVSILDDIDFEVELIHRDNVNVSYILDLVIRLRREKPDEYRRQVQAIISTLESEPELRSKKELIQRFIEEHVPAIPKDGDVNRTFEQYLSEQREQALQSLCDEEGLDRDGLDRVIRNYLYTGKRPLPVDVIRIMDEKPRLRERRTVGERIIGRIVSYVDTFIDGMD
ncbi:MAG: type I restriction endonuclease subunit R [Gammaproteobacteria bacterium]|nr:type I restriction endonuclease subunit R [Gammaproteobacteria bacterium]